MSRLSDALRSIGVHNEWGLVEKFGEKTDVYVDFQSKGSRSRPRSREGGRKGYVDGRTRHAYYAHSDPGGFPGERRVRGAMPNCNEIKREHVLDLMLEDGHGTDEVVAHADYYARRITGTRPSKTAIARIKAIANGIDTGVAAGTIGVAV